MTPPDLLAGMITGRAGNKKGAARTEGILCVPRLFGSGAGADQISAF